MPQSRESRRLLARYLIEEGRSQKQRADPVTVKICGKFLRRQHYVPADADELCSIEQRSPDLESRRIEGRTRCLCDAVRRLQVNVVSLDYEAGDRAMSDRDAFRLTCRA